MAKMIAKPTMYFRVAARFVGGEEIANVRAKTPARAIAMARADFENWEPKSNPMNKPGFTKLEVVEAY